MTAFSFGCIVLVEFPHTNMQGSSKRPALVLYDVGDKDILVARITTQEYYTESDYKIISWRDSGLLAESYIRLSKVATMEKRFIVRDLGRMPVEEADKIKEILRKMLLL